MMTVEGETQVDGCDRENGCSERGVDQFNEKCNVKVCVGRQ